MRGQQNLRFKQKNWECIFKNMGENVPITANVGFLLHNPRVDEIV